MEEIVGKKFNKILVIKYIKSLKISGISRNFYECLCDCGKEFTARRDHIIKDKIKSCGCYRRQKATGRIAWNRKPEGMCAARQIFTGYKRNASRKNREFTISFDDFLKITKQNCFYCGRAPLHKWDSWIRTGVKKGYSKMNGSYMYNGIDRIDNENGYSIDNIRPCCKTCNIAKSDLSEENFYKWIENVIKTRNERCEQVGL